MPKSKHDYYLFDYEEPIFDDYDNKGEIGKGTMSVFYDGRGVNFGRPEVITFVLTDQYEDGSQSLSHRQVTLDEARIFHTLLGEKLDELDSRE